MFSKAEQKKKVGQLKYKKEQNPDNFCTAIGGLKVEYRNQLSKDDRMTTLVSTVVPFHGETIVNKMEKLGKEAICDAIVKTKLCKVYRGAVAESTKTELADPGFFTNKICHYCKEKGHLKNGCPELAQKHPSGNKCEYLGCITPSEHSTDKC